MKKKINQEPTTSLLDSVFYQSALRSNRLEDNRLKKLQLRLEQDFEKAFTYYDNNSRNSYDWAIEMRKNSGRSFPVIPSRMKSKPTRPQTVPEHRPSCCVLYGMIIGERPVLLKNFLGKKAKKKKGVGEQSAKNHEHFPASHNGVNDNKKSVQSDLQQTPSREHDHEKQTANGAQADSDPDNQLKSFMIDNKLVTQVPIGYSRSSVRPRTCFVTHTSEMLRPENTRTPGYYTLRYKYVLPPVGMTN